MSGQSSKKTIEENVLDLLFGLVNAEEAESLRRLVATDSEVARVYDDVRKIFADAAQAVRVESPFIAKDNSKFGNVTVDSGNYDPATNLGFDAAVGSFESGVFVSSNETVADGTYLENDVLLDSEKNQRSRKSRKALKKATVNVAAAGESKKNKNFKFWFRNAFNVLFAFLTFGFKSFGKASLFLRMVILLSAFGLCISLAIGWQEYRLRSIFSEDYRVQAIVPQILVRNVPQSINVTTADISGNPRRAPVRFNFSDAITGEFLLLHTEGGSASGNVKYDLPDMNDFPSKVKLAIWVGSDKSEMFEEVLSVQDSYKETLQSLNADCNHIDNLEDADNSFGSPSENGGGLFSPISDLALEIANAPGRVDNADGTREKTKKDEVDSLQSSAELLNVSLRPELGSLIFGFTNRVAVYCSDCSGRPVSQKFTLKGNEAEITSFETDGAGLGSFEFIPVEGKQYFLFKADDVSDIQENSADAGADVVSRSDDILSETKGDFQSAVLKIDESLFLSSSLYVRPLERILSWNSPVVFTTSVAKKTSLVVTVEKDKGIVASQSLLTLEEGEQKFSVNLPESAFGLLKVSFYERGTDFLKRIGTSYVFRKTRIRRPLLNIGLVEEKPIASLNGESGEPDSNEQVAISVFYDNRVQLNPSDSEVEVSGDEKPSTLTLYWAQNYENAISILTIDDLLSNASDEKRGIILDYLPSYLVSNSPILLDNLWKIKSTSAVKFQEFHEQEKKTASLITEFGVVGCALLATLTLFFIVFNTIPFWRGIIVVLIACMLIFFFFLEQKTLDYSSKASEKMGITSLEKLQDNQALALSRIFDSTWVLREANGSQDETYGRLAMSRKIGNGKTMLFLDELLMNEERNSGVVLFKVDNGMNQTWFIKDLPLIVNE